MARPRKTDPSTLIRPLIEEFAFQLAGAVQRFTVDRIESAVRSSVRGYHGNGSAGLSRRTRVLCYFPGCKNTAAPRFGMFCAAQHKNLSRTEKEKYRSRHSTGLANE